jgi:transposase
MRGVAFLTVVTFVAEIGDVRRFESPRQLMAYLGLAPSERKNGLRRLQSRHRTDGHRQLSDGYLVGWPMKIHKGSIYSFAYMPR